MIEGWHFGLLLSRLLTKGSFESSLIPIFFLVIRWTPSDFIDGVLESCWAVLCCGLFLLLLFRFFFEMFVYPPPVSILVVFVGRVQTDFDVVFRFRCLYSLFVLTSPDWFCRVLILTLSSASGVYIRYLFSTNPDWLDCFSASGVSTRSFRWTSPDFLMVIKINFCESFLLL